MNPQYHVLRTSSTSKLHTKLIIVYIFVLEITEYWEDVREKKYPKGKQLIIYRCKMMFVFSSFHLTVDVFNKPAMILKWTIAMVVFRIYR